MNKRLSLCVVALGLWLFGATYCVDANADPYDTGPMPQELHEHINYKESEDTVYDMLDFLMGDWYHTDGSYAFTVGLGKFNGYIISGGYDFAGGSAFGAGSFVIEGEDKPKGFSWEVMGIGDHNLLILNGKEVYRRNSVQAYTESVSGVYLGMRQQDVEKLLGQPSNKLNVDQLWVYTDKGFTVEFKYGLVTSIILFGEKAVLKNTGLGLLQDNSTIQFAYGLEYMNFDGVNEGYCGEIASGEHLFIYQAPRRLRLTIYPY